MPERSEICWSSMFYVQDVVCSRYKEILITLLKRAEEHDAPALTCGGIYHKLATGKMILKCVILKRSLAITTHLGKYKFRMDKCCPGDRIVQENDITINIR